MTSLLQAEPMIGSSGNRLLAAGIQDIRGKEMGCALDDCLKGCNLGHKQSWATISVVRGQNIESTRSVYVDRLQLALIDNDVGASLYI